MFSRPSALLRSKSGRLGCMLAMVAALAGCGGSVVDEFQPARIISLGDEYSYIDGSGRKYTVNAFKAAPNDTEINCDANRIWNQQLVESYGFSFAECNPNNRDASKALLYARPGARVADGADSIASQIAAHQAAGGFNRSDLVIVMAGANDIHALAQDNSFASDEARLLEADRLGRALAQQLNALANAGTPVVVVSVPDQGRTPEAQQAGAVQKERLHLVTRSFNDALNTALVNDGRKIGWVGAEGEINALQFNESPIYSVTERTVSDTEVDIACPAGTTATGCDTGNSVGNYGNYLYAYGRHLSTTAHTRLFAIAESRARDNPF